MTGAKRPLAANSSELYERRYGRCDVCSLGTGCPARTDHPQVHVAVVAQEACVDELIAPLIQHFWTAGVATMFSCQGERAAEDPNRWASVTFANGQSFDLALESCWQMLGVATPAAARLWGSARNGGRGSSQRRPRNAWRHAPLLHVEYIADVARLRVRHQLRLPQEDLLRLAEFVEGGRAEFLEGSEREGSG